MNNDCLNKRAFLILDLIESYPVTARLANCIRAAFNGGHLPYNNVGEYLDAGIGAVNAFLNLPNMGMKTAMELDLLIRENFQLSIISPNQEDANCSSTFLDISIPEFVNSRIVSKRLENAIKSLEHDGSCPYPTVRAYLKAGSEAKRSFAGLHKIGKKTAAELDQLIKEFGNDSFLKTLGADETTAFPQITNLAEMLIKINEILSEREHFILRSRLVKNLTLQNTADDFGVTRERVRQIEAKALRKLRKFLHPVYDSLLTFVENSLTNDNYATRLALFSQLSGVNIDDALFSIKILNHVNPDFEEKYAILDDHLYVINQFIDENEWDNRLAEAVYKSELPMELHQFINDVSDVPYFYVHHYLINTLGAEIQDGKIFKISNLGVSEMCIKVLMQEKRPLHTSEMRSRLHALFGKESTEQAIGAVLGRLKEALIVGPGTYALYEHLRFSEIQLDEIREKVYEYLLDKGRFISTKVIFQTLFSHRLHEFPDIFNDYIVLGVAQDDKRFISKRGNMLGLSSFEVQETFISLEDEVLSIVETHGPISINQIMHMLSDTRKLCNDSGVRHILEYTPNIIAVGKKVYDLNSRFFKNEVEYERLKTALKVILISGEKSSFAISSELVQIGFQKYDIETIESILRGIQDIKENVDIFLLQKRSIELDIYNEVVVANIDKSIELIRKELYKKIPFEFADKFLSFDLRVINSDKKTVPSKAHAEINQLLSDFGI